MNQTGMTEQAEHPAGARTVWRAFTGWLTQRSTLLGLALIIFGVPGVWLGLIDEGTAATLLVFSGGFLIPEEWPIARQIMTFMAPILTHQIATHHLAALSRTPQPPDPAPASAPDEDRDSADPFH